MKRVTFILLVLLLSTDLTRAAQSAGRGFPDLAVLLAKGWFGRYVGRDASLEECAAFLNKHGICFSLFDLMDTQKVVTKEDFARVVGQASLLFSGEYELNQGCIKKPLESESWIDYCLLNDVNLEPLWDGFVNPANAGVLQEVQSFFIKKTENGGRQ